MMVYRTRTGAQGGHEFPFDCTRESRFETFRGTEKIECLDVAWISPQPSFGKKFCATDPIAKFLSSAAVCFRLIISVRAGAVESGFEFPRFVQLLQPQTRGVTLRTGRVVRCDVDHLLKTFARTFVIEIVECVIPFRPQRIEFLLTQSRSQRDECNEESDNYFHRKI